MQTTIPHSGPATSRAAAESIAPIAGHLRRLVCEFIAKAGARGCTDEEIALGLGISGDTVRPRRGECWAHGLITDSLGEVRRTGSGRAAKVWHVTAVGLKAVGMAGEGWCVK